MAEIAKATNMGGWDSSNPSAPQIAGNQIAGEDIAPRDLVYKSATDGKWYRASGAAANAAAAHVRLAPIGTRAGRPIDVFQPGVRWKASNGGLTDGGLYYLSATVPGGITDTPTTGDPATAGGTVQAVSDTDVVLIRW